MKRYETQLCGKNDPTFSGLTLYKDPETNKIAAVRLPGSNSLYAPAMLEKHIDHMQTYDESLIRPEKGEFTMLMVRGLALSSFMENRYDTKTHEGSNAALGAIHKALRAGGAELNINNPLVQTIRAQENQTGAPKPVYPKQAFAPKLQSRP